MIIDAIKSALENMDKRYCTLSQIDYSQLELNAGLILEKKLLERPFAYEFYHQIRRLLEFGSIDL